MGGVCHCDSHIRLFSYFSNTPRNSGTKIRHDDVGLACRRRDIFLCRIDIYSRDRYPVLSRDFYAHLGTLFGHYLEARSSAPQECLLKSRSFYLKAHRVRNGKEEDIDVPELAVGDTVIVRHGEKIPADGTVESGLSNVDESLISGESKPIEKKKGDFVVAGSVSIDGALTVTLTRVGEYSTVGQIQKLVGEAQRTKPRSQRIADTASAALTFIAVVVALSHPCVVRAFRRVVRIRHDACHHGLLSRARTLWLAIRRSRR